jgi:hypothetical protein
VSKLIEFDGDMRCESIEFGWTLKAAKHRRKAGRALLPSRSKRVEPHAADAVFADLGIIGGHGAHPAVDSSLVTTLAAQLKALDRQREHLANLLQSIEVRSESSLRAAR